MSMFWRKWLRTWRRQAVWLSMDILAVSLLTNCASTPEKPFVVAKPPVLYMACGSRLARFNLDTRRWLPAIPLGLPSLPTHFAGGVVPVGPVPVDPYPNAVVATYRGDKAYALMLVTHYERPMGGIFPSSAALLKINLLSGNTQQVVGHLDLEPGRMQYLLAESPSGDAAYFSTNYRKFFVVGTPMDRDSSLHVLHLQMHHLQMHPSSGNIIAPDTSTPMLAFSPDGRWLFALLSSATPTSPAASPFSGVAAINAKTTRLLPVTDSLGLGADPSALVVGPHGDLYMGGTFFPSGPPTLPISALRQVLNNPHSAYKYYKQPQSLSSELMVGRYVPTANGFSLAAVSSAAPAFAATIRKEGGFRLTGLLVLPGGHSLLVAEGSLLVKLSLPDLVTRAVVAPLSHLVTHLYSGLNLWSLSLSPQGHHIYALARVLGRPGNLVVLNANTLTLEANYPLAGNCNYPGNIVIVPPYT